MDIFGGQMCNREKVNRPAGQPQLACPETPGFFRADPHSLEWLKMAEMAEMADIRWIS